MCIYLSNVQVISRNRSNIQWEDINTSALRCMENQSVMHQGVSKMFSHPIPSHTKICQKCEHK